MKKEKADQNAVAELTREGLYKENKWLWEENNRLKNNAMEDMRVQTKLEDRIKELEQCNLNLQTWLDNKEKVNKSLREELEKRRFSLDEYDYIILTSTTPQIEIIKK